jgi:hypothetical protein
MSRKSYPESAYRYDHDPENRERKRLFDYIRKGIGVENLDIGDSIVNEPLSKFRPKALFMVVRKGIIIVSSKRSKVGRPLRKYNANTDTGALPRFTPEEKRLALKIDRTQRKKNLVYLETQKLRGKVWSHPERFEIGQYV